MFSATAIACICDKQDLKYRSESDEGLGSRVAFPQIKRRFVSAFTNRRASCMPRVSLNSSIFPASPEATGGDGWID